MPPFSWYSASSRFQVVFKSCANTGTTKMKKTCALEGLWGSDSTHYARVSLCLLSQEHLSEGPGEPPGGGNPSTKPSQARGARFWTRCSFPSLSLGTCSPLLGPGRTLPPADRAVPSHPGIAWQRAAPGEQTAGGLPHCIQTPAPFSLAHFSLVEERGLQKPTL